MNQQIIIKLSLVTIALFYVVPIFAQPTPPQNAPIDGGLSLLIAGGVGYGIKKVRQRKK